METILSLDLKKNRIRLHKTTLHALSDPKYVHFMVNPQKGTLIIVPCAETANDALKITYRASEDCNLYSKALTNLLSKLNPEMDKGTTYRIFGKVNEKAHFAMFSINEMVPVDSLSQQEGSESK